MDVLIHGFLLFYHHQICHHFSVKSGCSNHCQEYRDVLQILIEKGATVNAVDKDSHTALDAVFEANESAGKFGLKVSMEKFARFVICLDLPPFHVHAGFSMSITMLKTAKKLYVC